MSKIPSPNIFTPRLQGLHSTKSLESCLLINRKSVFVMFMPWSFHHIWNQRSSSLTSHWHDSPLNLGRQQGWLFPSYLIDPSLFKVITVSKIHGHPRISHLMGFNVSLLFVSEHADPQVRCEETHSWFGHPISHLFSLAWNRPNVASKKPGPDEKY